MAYSSFNYPAFGGNAVRHGIAVKEDGGSVQVMVSKLNSELHVSVRDDGVGMNKKQNEDIFKKNNLEYSSEGIGLKNINQRMEQIYGPQYKIVIESGMESGTTVNLRIPVARSGIRDSN